MNFESARAYARDNPVTVAVLCHLLIAAFFFSDYFLFGQILVGSKDSITQKLPMLLAQKDAFLSGHINLWEPHIASGTPLSRYSLFHPALSPENWLYYLAPAKNVFSVITFVAFLKLWLIGVFAFFLFREEFGSDKWAFFSSAMLQLSGHAIWSTTTHENSMALMCATAVLYVVWSSHRRGSFLNYFYMAIGLVVLAMSATVNSGAYWLIVIFVMFLYRFLSSGRKARLFFAFSGALMTAVLIMSVRLLPIYLSVRDTQRLVHGLDPNFVDKSFLGLRLFVPEIFGVNFIEYFRVFNLMSPQLSGLHLDFAMRDFFGVLPAFLCLWAVVSLPRGRVLFWTIYTVAAFGLTIYLEPMETIGRILLHPVYHPDVADKFFPLGFCFLAGHAAMSFEGSEGNERLYRQVAYLLSAVAAIVFLFGLTIWVPVFEEYLQPIRMAIVVIAALCVALAVSYRRWFPLVRRDLMPIIVASIIGCIMGIVVLGASDSIAKENMRFLIISTAMLLYICGFVYYHVNEAQPGVEKYLKSGRWLMAASLIALIYPWTERLLEWNELSSAFLTALLGFMKFAVVSVLFGAVAYLFSRGKLKASVLFPIFLAVLLAEQLPANKIHSYRVINAFYHDGELFPAQPEFKDSNGDALDLDLKNYRVGHPHAMLKIPILIEGYGPNYEVLGSIFPLYGIRSYGGYINAVYQRYLDFYAAFAPEERVERIGVRNFLIKTAMDDERFLDLTGTRYDYDAEKDYVKVRPNALSRFMLYDSYDVIKEPSEVLERLKAPDFQFRRTVLLEEEPGIASGEPDEDAREVEYVEHTPDEIEIHLTSERPSVLLFDDTYDGWWRVYVNGKERPVLRANYTFMATTVPAGPSTVVFRFEQETFVYGAYAAVFGAGLSVLFAIAMLVFKGNLDAGVRRPQSALALRMRMHFISQRPSYVALAILALTAVLQGVL